MADNRGASRYSPRMRLAMACSALSLICLVAALLVGLAAGWWVFGLTAVALLVLAVRFAWTEMRANET